MKLPVLAAVVSLAAVIALCGRAAEAEIYLDHISTIYIPYSYLPVPKYYIDSDAVEQFSYDVANNFVYLIGDDYLQIIDYQNISNPTIVYKHALPHRANDIAHCGDFVAYTIQGSDSQEPGKIYVYNKFDRQTNKFEKVFESLVNSQPEMITFTPDCGKILTADEGTAGDNALETAFVNPEGMVSIIKIDNDDPANPAFHISSVSFDHLNPMREKYVKAGVRFPYNDHYGNFTEQTLSQSVEPEYIAINPRDNVAYINLQENNAIARLDLSSEVITEIIPLGVKNWMNLGIDPSDRDDAVAFQTGYDIKSFYMPDAIKYFEVGGVGYLATADEGSDLDYKYDRMYWSDAKRGETIHDSGLLASTVSSELKEALNDDLKLGRLEFSITDGFSESETGKIEELFFFGGRGFSILRASDLTRVYDSGDDIEHLVARFYPQVFNSETYPDHADREMPTDLIDKRSDNRGPECETIEVGEVNGKTVVFVGVDRASVIAIYTVDSSGQASFESLHRRGGLNKTFEELLRERNLGDLDPKDIEFVSADQSPTKKPLLMVAGTASGTIALYEVKDDKSGKSAIIDGNTGGGNGGVQRLSTSGTVAACIFSVLAMLLHK